MTPLRQFKGVPADVIRKAEGKQFVSELPFPVLRELTLYLCSHGIGTLIW